LSEREGGGGDKEKGEGAQYPCVSLLYKMHKSLAMQRFCFQKDMGSFYSLSPFITVPAVTLKKYFFK